MKCFPCVDAGSYRGFGYQTGKKYHLGHDFNCPFGSTVHSISDGVVIFSDKVNGFGSFEEPGGVIIIKHRDKYDHEFLALYGHVRLSVSEGMKVNKGDIIGSIIKYETSQFRADHLHFGINTHIEMPKFPWGYSEDFAGWVNPIEYIFNHL